VATRDANLLELAAFERMVDELAGQLRTVHFYNYGETFLHRDAATMMSQLRRSCPDATIVTSTNGIPLSRPGLAEAVVRAQPTEITFTISGVNQASYERYHVRGRLDQALGGLAATCAAKRRLRLDAPTIVWRYLVFRWNDTQEEILQAIELADRYGVDRLSLYLTNTPENVRSIDFSPGSPRYLRFLPWIHRDHEGRLDHGYPCELPDSNGLYAEEHIAGLGRVRWTASRAVVAVRPVDGQVVLRVFLPRTRASADGQGAGCQIRTPWGTTHQIAPVCATWREVRIPVPRRHCRADVHLELSTDDYWYPAVEDNSVDFRCLGVLIPAT
jgi:hypothetical protein